MTARPRTVLTLAATFLSMVCGHAEPALAAPDAIDCTGPARDAQPNTPAWFQREAENAFCATQRNLDTHTNPTYAAALLTDQGAAGRVAGMDPAREPTRHDGTRFRFEERTITDATGKAYPTFLFRPCDGSCTSMPEPLEPYEPRYPGVVIMHGGAANHELYLWAAEGLAEAGYMVVTVNIGRTDDGHYEATKAALDWLTSIPARPFADDSFNPHWRELDRGRIGLAGHSAGGVAVSRLGQEDERVDAIVSWDRAQSSGMPADLALRTPALFFTADYNCQKVPVCLPEPRASAPDPLGPGMKDEDFRRLRAAGIDTMKVALRAAVHLDWTEWPELNASRYGAVTTLYFTQAWFDRYLKRDRHATQRLTAARFDDSADIHNISTGRFDAATLSNLPARIAGQPVVDRLSFNFRSGYWLERGRLTCESMRDRCTAARRRARLASSTWCWGWCRRSTSRRASRSCGRRDRRDPR
jgi:dienelactone hydrolase